MEIITKSSSQTKKIGKKLAEEILKIEGQNKAIILGLEGDLGVGKTTFLQGFAKGLGIQEKILSPTFIILKKFPISNFQFSNFSNFSNFYHIDCYRIQKPKEFLDLGFKEIISNPQNIVAIEWSGRIQKILPKKIIKIKIKFVNKNTRHLIISYK